MKQLGLWAVVGVSLLLGACTKQADSADVYTPKGQAVTTIKGRSGVAYLSTIVGDAAGAHRTALPAKAKLSYHYVLNHIHPASKVHLYVYRNVNLIRVKGLPVVGEGVWRISGMKRQQLNQPQKLQ